MRRLALIFSACFLLGLNIPARAQDRAPNSSPPKEPGASSARKDAEAEVELQKALSSAGNDRVALVRNLKDYIQRFPDAPRRAGVFRALVESCEQLRDDACAADYAERFIAIEPEDSEMMMLAVDLLKKQGDEASLTRANGYASRVLDRMQKSNPDERPPRTSLPEWQETHNRLLAALYYERGQIESSQHNFDAAVDDLRFSFRTRANAPAAEALGEIAEKRHDPAGAIEEYLIAFVLPEGGPGGKVNRRAIRMKLGNVWREVHGSDQGLSEQILAAYDHLAAPPGTANPAVRNDGAKDPFDFVLRRLDGPPMPLAPLKGKIVVLSFWATWCGPCRELEPLFGQIERSYTGSLDLAFFAANTDEDESLVVPFLANVKWPVTVVYADGLDNFLKVTTLPTVLILGRDGKIVYRIGGFQPQDFSESLHAAIQSALAPAK